MSGQNNDYESLTVACGKALSDHYADNKWQTFHHEPSVAAVVLEAVPDGWARVDGHWVRLVQYDRSCESDGVGGHWHVNPDDVAD